MRSAAGGWRRGPGVPRAGGGVTPAGPPHLRARLPHPGSRTKVSLAYQRSTRGSPAMADKAPRRPRTPRLATVLRTSRPTPHLVRVVLGGEGLAGFAPEHTDAYVKLVLPPAGAPYAAPFDVEAVQR